MHTREEMLEVYKKYVVDMLVDVGIEMDFLKAGIESRGIISAYMVHMVDGEKKAKLFNEKCEKLCIIEQVLGLDGLEIERIRDEVKADLQQGRFHGRFLDSITRKRVLENL